MIMIMMYNMQGRVPRPVIDRNNGWIPPFKDDSQLITHEEQSRDIFYTREKLNSSVGVSSERERSYDSATINDLRSSNDMLDEFLNQVAQPRSEALYIRNYLSSTYLNPTLNPRMTGFAPHFMQKNFPRI